jgi:hypothetical protein
MSWQVSETGMKYRSTSVRGHMKSWIALHGEYEDDDGTDVRKCGTDHYMQRCAVQSCPSCRRIWSKSTDYGLRTVRATLTFIHYKKFWSIFGSKIRVTTADGPTPPTGRSVTGNYRFRISETVFRTVQESEFRLNLNFWLHQTSDE